MRNQAVTLAELTNARQYEIRSIPVQVSSVNGIACSLPWSWHGEPLDQPMVAAKYHLNFTATEVQDAFKKYLKPQNLTQVVQGPSLAKLLSQRSAVPRAAGWQAFRIPFQRCRNRRVEIDGARRSVAGRCHRAAMVFAARPAPSWPAECSKPGELFQLLPQYETFRYIESESPLHSHVIVVADHQIDDAVSRG